MALVHPIDIQQQPQGQQGDQAGRADVGNWRRQEEAARATAGSANS